MEPPYRKEVIEFYHESASAKIVVWSDDRAILSNLYSREVGLGHASLLMNKILYYADTHDLTVYLVAQRYGYADKRGLTNDQLIAFYRKFGFYISENSTGQVSPVIMKRKPLSQDLQPL